MKVKSLRCHLYQSQHFATGHVRDIPDADVAELIAMGCAEATEEPVTTAAEEAPAEAPAETKASKKK